MRSFTPDVLLTGTQYKYKLLAVSAFFLSPSMYHPHLQAQYPALSSPPSPPSLCIDSSPLSSPTLDPIHLDSSFDLGKLTDPFAGSFNSTKAPPQYEKKKRRGTVVSPPSSPKRARHRQDTGEEEHQFDECMPLPLHLQPSPRREKTAVEMEMEEWNMIDDDIYRMQMRVVDVS